MSFKKMILVLTITFSAIFTLMLGSSYAYYVSTGGTTLNATTGNFDNPVSIVFGQGDYVNIKTGVPIREEQLSVYTTSYNNFYIIPNATILDGYEASATISLTDISIDEELKVSDFKYYLVCYNIAGNLAVPFRKIGTGLDFTDEVLDSNNLVVFSSLDISREYECSFYVYLEENGSDQNHLMNKNFSARIKIDSAFRKVE